MLTAYAQYRIRGVYRQFTALWKQAFLCYILGGVSLNTSNIHYGNKFSIRETAKALSRPTGGGGRRSYASYRGR